MSMFVRRAWAPLGVCKDVDRALRASAPICFRHLVGVFVLVPIVTRELDTVYLT